MSGSSPADLAVAFRSLARRQREVIALAEDEPSVLRAATGPLAALRSDVERAAGAMHVTAAPDLAAAGTQLADAIESIPADQWDAATLDELRQAALDAGRHLRQARQAVERAGGR